MMSMPIIRLLAFVSLILPRLLAELALGCFLLEPWLVCVQIGQHFTILDVADGTFDLWPGQSVV